MKLYKNVKKLTDLSELSKLSGAEELVVAYKNKNYVLPLSSIRQHEITKLIQTPNNISGKEQPISLIFRDSNSKPLYVFNGSIGDTGDKGDTGEVGLKGDNADIDKSRSDNWLWIINDVKRTDEDKTKAALSAYQGMLMHEKLKALSETFLSEYDYMILTDDSNFILLETEFITTERDQTVQLINEDKDSHVRYVKYWTYENEGAQEFYVYDHVTDDYYLIYADLWDDIYFGGRYGYFEAVNEQLYNGNVIYVKNSDNEYVAINIDEEGNVIEPPYNFKYWLNTIKAYIRVINDGNSYDYELDAINLPLNVYARLGEDEYKLITDKSEIDINGTTAYYYIDNNGDYIFIENIESYIERKEFRYYISSGNGYQEVESLDNYVSDIENFRLESYIIAQYNKLSNETSFTKYDHVKTVIDEYYSESSGTINNYTIKYYIYDDNRQYFTRRLVSKEKENGTYEYYYEYIPVVIPFWIEAEFITTEEDQRIMILNSNIDDEGEDVDKVEPKYIQTIEFIESTSQSNPLVIARDAVKNIDVNVWPTDANITDMTLDYDDNYLTLYEDGRIVAIDNDEITFNTSITVTSDHDNSINDTIYLKVVTPVKEITLNEKSINLYPGETFTLEYVIYPEFVSDDSVSFIISDNDMVILDENGNITPRRQADGTYKTGNCSITAIANDGFGATAKIDILVAIPVESLIIKNKDFAFVGRSEILETEIVPSSATKKTLEYWSDDDEIITINSSTGVFTPLKNGICKLHARTTDGTYLEAEKEIKVTTGVSSIKFENINDKLEVGLTNTFNITVLPENADNKDITFIVSDSSVVEHTTPKLTDTDNVYEVSVTATKPGLTVIQAIAKDGTDTVGTHSMQITTPMGGITFENTEITIFETEQVRLTPIIISSNNECNVDNTEYEWHVGNENIVSINPSNGIVTGKSAGTTYVSVISKDNNGIIGTCKVTVLIAVNEIELNKGDYNTIELIEGNYGFIEAKVKPDNASIQILSWESSNSEFVEVEDNGTIFGKKITPENENVIITATSTDGKAISQSISVKVIENIDENK